MFDKAIDLTSFLKRRLLLISVRCGVRRSLSAWMHSSTDNAGCQKPGCENTHCTAFGNPAFRNLRQIFSTLFYPEKWPKVAKSRVAKNRVAKSRVAKNRVAKSRVAKNRVAKSRVAKNRVAKSRVAKTRVAKSRVAKNRVAKTPVPNYSNLTCQIANKILG